MKLHKACLEMKIKFQKNEEAIQKLKLKHHTLYSLTNINQRAQLEKMKPPHKVNYIQLDQ